MKVVIDTNCLLVSLSISSRYYCLWRAFCDKQFTICYTTDIINEYSEILSRFFHHQMVNDVINDLLFAPNVIKADIYFRWNLITADLDDNKFVDCALNAGADFIVTNDRHFNVLKSLSFPPIKVIDIDSFKNILKL